MWDGKFASTIIYQHTKLVRSQVDCSVYVLYAINVTEALAARESNRTSHHSASIFWFNKNVFKEVKEWERWS